MFWVSVISAKFFLLPIESATISDISHLYGQGNLIFIREKVGNYETDVCDNYA